MSTDNKIKLLNLNGYFVEIIIFIFVVIFITKIIPIKTQILYPLVVLLFSFPIIIFNFYKISMTKKMSLSKFHTEGRIYRFIAGRKLVYIILIISAPIISAYAVLKMYGFSFKEWLTIFIMVPVFIFVFNFLYKHFVKEIKNVYVNFFTVHWTILLVYAVIVVVFPLIVYALGNFEQGSISSLNEAVKVQTEKYAILKDCSIASVIASKIAFLEGLISYTLSNLNGWRLFIAVLITAGEGLVFLSILSSFSLFLLRKDEISIIYKPISSSHNKDKRKKIIFTLSLSVIFIIYLGSYIFIENKLKTDKKLIKFLDAPQKQFVDIIDGQYVNKGTIDKLQKIKNQFESKMFMKINKKIDNAYDSVINNVDNYLDWYYGLTAEYIRLTKLASGQLKGYIMGKLHLTLKIDNIFKPVFAEIKEIAKNSKKEFEKIADKLIKVNIIKSIKVFDTVIINKTTSFKKVFMLKNTKIIDKISIKYRASFALLGGITGSIIGKIMAKKIIKMSGKVIAKILLKKSAGVIARIGAGALAGGAGGSVVPGIGTSIGAVIGGIIGFIVTDYATLKLEEVISRKAYKKEIIDAINESRKEFKKWY